MTTELDAQAMRAQLQRFRNTVRHASEHALQDFVQTISGEYFFFPSLTAIKALANLVP
tara:strand:- start:445 stop:618 length:174 start_codon:yes stop_codon:yes gene_type:complete